MELLHSINPIGNHTTTRVVFVIHEIATIKIFQNNLFDDTFKREFYGSKNWPARPNSTARLTLANCQALQSLPEYISVDIWGGFELDEEFLSVANDADILVVNQIASVKSFEFLNGVTSLLKDDEIRCKLILGTEGTWQSLIKNEQMSEEDIHYLFMEHLILRHTARTDRFVYDGSDRYLNSNVQEFELGINTSLIKPNSPEGSPAARDKVLFVKAPEGRKTKNNELVDEFIEKIKQDNRISYLECKVLEPPYSAVEYWDLLEQAKYIIFTSVGETFSYVYNDARAAGVVGFMPSQMYINMLGRRFAVDSYPEIGIRYTEVSEVLNQIDVFETDTYEYSKETLASVESTRNKFGIGSLTSKWASLFVGETLNSNKLLILGAAESLLSESEVFKLMDSHGSKFVLSLQNKSSISPKPGRLSRQLPNGKISLSDWISAHGSELFRSLGVDDNGWLTPTSRPKVRKIDPLEARDFYRLLTRINKIGTLVIAPETSSSSFVSDIGTVKQYMGVNIGMKALKVEIF